MDLVYTMLREKKSIFSDHFVSFFWLAGNFGSLLHMREATDDVILAKV